MPDEAVVCDWARELREKLGVRRIVGVASSSSLTAFGTADIVDRDILRISSALWTGVTPRS